MPAAEGYMLDAGQIFTLFFIMLGPLGLIIPFGRATMTMDSRQRRKVAITGTAIATFTLLLGGFLGCLLLEKWHIPVPVLLLTAGLLFFLVVLPTLTQPPPAEPKEEPQPTAGRVAFQMMIKPYGMAALIVLLAISHDQSRTMEIYAILIAIMLLNLLTLISARKILKAIGPLPMPMLFAALGVLQAALALTIIVHSLHQIIAAV